MASGDPRTERVLVAGLLGLARLPGVASAYDRRGVVARTHVGLGNGDPPMRAAGRLDGMEQPIQIRSARQGDGPACAELWVEFGRALAERMPGFREPDRAGLPEWFERGIAQTGAGVLRALACVDANVVGLAHAMIRPPQDPPGPSLITAQLTTRLMLEDIVVARGWRGRGIGTALLHHVEAWGRQHRATTMMLNSDAEGPARRFYERHGFTISGALYGKEL